MKTFVAVLFAVLVLVTGPVPAGAQNMGGDSLVDCRINDGPCVKTPGSLSAFFDITPKPVRAMREVAFTVVLKDRGKPVTDASLVIGLTMPGMYMGTNKILLSHRQDGIYEGKGVIIRCPSGKKVWKAEVSIQRNSLTSAASFIFEVN